MDAEEATPQAAEGQGDPQQMLGNLRQGTGHWHDLARFLPRLQRLGYDSVLIEQETGMERRVQDKWQVSPHVWW